MNPIEMGKVFAYLLKYRMIESKPGNRRNSRPGEQEMAGLLQLSEPDALAILQDFLLGQGLQLREYRDTEFKGIPRNGRVWVLMRSATEPVPAYFGSDRLHRTISLRDNESRLTSGTWFLHIWLMYLALVYTRLGRGVSQVSEFHDAVFTKEQLIDSVESHIEIVRKSGVEKGVEEKVFETLNAAKGSDIARRVKSFIWLMCDAGLIESIDDDTYQQTLLGAAEFADSYSRTMRHYLNINESNLSKLTNVSNILKATGVNQTKEVGTDVSN